MCVCVCMCCVVLLEFSLDVRVIIKLHHRIPIKSQLHYDLPKIYSILLVAKRILPSLSTANNPTP